MKKQVVKSSKTDRARISHDFLITPEERELKRRWPIALRELTSLVERIRDIHGRNEEKLPEAIADVEKKHLIEALYRSLLEDDMPELKRSVARRMANKIGDYLLWRRESSTPVIHEFVALMPWWFSRMPGEVVRRIRDIGLRYVINGQVLPLQTVWKDVLDAPLVYMGHCVCRSSGIVDDLYLNGNVRSLIPEKDKQVLLNRFMNRYRAIMKKYGELPDTHPHYVKIFRELDDLRRAKSPDYRLETLLAHMYPSIEIIPVADKYTRSWIRSLHRNNKAHLLFKELVFEFATIQYLSRGIIYTSMRLFDTPYTICSCPTPETGGGCVLTNWYYEGNSPYSLLPNQDGGYGQLKNESGNVLPCRFFPMRSQRPCIGCGCKHDEPAPRGTEMILKQADNALRAYRRVQGVK